MVAWTIFCQFSKIGVISYSRTSQMEIQKKEGKQFHSSVPLSLLRRGGVGGVRSGVFPRIILY